MQARNNESQLYFSCLFTFYIFFQVKSGECKELFPTGSQQQEPIVTLYEGSGFIVGRDNMSIFIDPEGNPTKKHPVKWSDIPLEIGM